VCYIVCQSAELLFIVPIGVSLNLLKLGFCIDRRVEHTQFVPADSQNMCILHLQAH
jgi:hypothetical protein